MTAKTTSWRLIVPPFLEYLEEKLNHRIRLHQNELGYDIYLVDFSSWRLRLSDHTPVIVVTETDLRNSSDDEIAQSISDVIRIRGYDSRMSLVVVQGDGAALREYFRASYTSALILDDRDQNEIVESRRPTVELLRRLSSQIQLSFLSPYETSKPVTGSRFFGRESIVRRVLMDRSANFAIMGIRRIGKTSLLKEIQARLREDEESDIERVIFMDCSVIRSNEQFLREVVRRLHIQDLGRINHRKFPLYFPDFIRRMSQRYHGPLVFLLDEIDGLLDGHLHDNELLETLRASSNSNHARFIVAGFRHLFHASSDQDSPVYNFAKTVRLKEFMRSEAAAMIVEPMRNMGIDFENQGEVVARIFEETAGQPNLIQFYCSTLVHQLDETGSRSISPDNLFSVHENEDIRTFVLNTFWDNTNHLEKAIVFSVISAFYPDSQHRDASRASFSLQDIYEALASHDANGPIMDVDRACQNLELAGTFVRTGRNFHFATPVFPRILSDSYNIDFLFDRILQEGIW